MKGQREIDMVVSELNGCKGVELLSVQMLREVLAREAGFIYPRSNRRHGLLEPWRNTWIRLESKQCRPRHHAARALDPT